MVWTEIFARKERQDVLDKAGIMYKVDQDLNLGFNSEREKEEALELFKIYLGERHN